jgi:choline kinase
MKLIVMAAGCGRRMGAVLHGRPKCLLEVGGRTLLDWQLDAWTRSDSAVEAARRVCIVTGFGAEHLEHIRERGCTLVHNPEHSTTNMVRSLFSAAAQFDDGFVMSYGDIAYTPEVMQRVLEHDAPISVVVDVDWREYWEARFDDVLTDAESLVTDGHGRIISVGQTVEDESEIEAQYIGLVAFRGVGVTGLREAYALAQSGDADAQRAIPSLAVRPAGMMFMTDLLQGLINLGANVAAVPIQGGWIEIDSPRDLQIAEERMAVKAHTRRVDGSSRRTPA